MPTKQNHNDMKKTTFIIALLVSFLIGASDLGYAQQTNTNKRERIPMRKSKGEKPRMPAMITVDCWYGDGELSIDFRNPEGECDITVTDTTTGFTVTDTFDSALPYTIYIGTPQSAVITLTTEEGNTYYGEIN